MTPAAAYAMPSAPALPQLARFAPALLALLCVLLPSYHDAALRLWKLEEHAYAPMLTALAYALIGYRAFQARVRPAADATALGLLLSLSGAASYVIGRSQQIELLELGACIPLIAGTAALLGGRPALRSLRFPILFLLFSLPYPGWLIDSLTGPLKEWISIGAERILYTAGYPIARSGVVLGLGPYRLLVADACSGLHSLIFLSAMSLLYIHLTGERRQLHRFALLAAVLPIAVLANFVRVLILLLLTYHFGDAVGQGYAHDLAGLILFVSAFAMLTGLDRALSRCGIESADDARTNANSTAAARAPAAPDWKRSLAVSLLLLSTAAAAALLAPNRLMAERRLMPNLETQVRQRFGDWRIDERAGVLLVAPDVQANLQRVYGQTLTRTYVDGAGRRIMLSIAYGGRQIGNELQAHRPEYCYKAQGFTLFDARDASIASTAGELPVRRLVARYNNRIEPITYCMTVGEGVVRPGLERKLAQLRYGLRGEIPDGMLIRVSSLGSDTSHAFRLHESFIADLQQALPESLRVIMLPQQGGSDPA